MPIFTLNTNLAKDKIPGDFLKTTAQLVAKTLGKPLSYVAVHVNPDQMMSWAGTSEPCATGQLVSIGALGRQENKKHSAALYPHVEKNLGIPGDRMYIQYVDLHKENCGFTGKTFDDLL